MTTAHKAYLSSEAKMYFMSQLNAQNERSRIARDRAFAYLDERQAELKRLWADETLRLEDIKTRYKGIVSGKQLDAYLEERLGCNQEMRVARSKRVYSARAALRRQTQKSTQARKAEQETVSATSRKLLGMRWTNAGAS